MLPHPDNPNLLTNNYRSRSYSTSMSGLPSIKLDYIFNEKHRISYLYSHFHSPATPSINQFEGLPGTGFPSDSLTEYHRLNDDYVIRPNLLNHLTIGYNHRHIYEAPAYVNTFPSDLANQIYLKGNPESADSRSFHGLQRRRRHVGQHACSRTRGNVPRTSRNKWPGSRAGTASSSEWSTWPVSIAGSTTTTPGAT